MERPHHSSSPVLSRTPPIIAGLTVRGRAGLCGVSDGCCVIAPPPLVLQIDSPDRSPPRARTREWWEGYKVSVSGNFGFDWKNKTQLRLWNLRYEIYTHKVNKLGVKIWPRSQAFHVLGQTHTRQNFCVTCLRVNDGRERDSRRGAVN